MNHVDLRAIRSSRRSAEHAYHPIDAVDVLMDKIHGALLGRTMAVIARQSDPELSGIQCVHPSVYAAGLGLTSPGRPSVAAERAWAAAAVGAHADAVHTHMFVAATAAASFPAEDALEAVYVGSGEIPDTSRLYTLIQWCTEAHRRGEDHVGIQARLADAYPDKPQRVLRSAGQLVIGLLYGSDPLDTVAKAADGGEMYAAAGLIKGALLGSEAMASWYEKTLSRRADVVRDGGLDVPRGEDLMSAASQIAAYAVEGARAG